MKSVTTVLFVENDAVALTMYQKRLQREGFHVEVAEDGIAALKVLSEMTPDIVILDLMLPKFSGRDVFDYMRADAQFKNVPVIIFSNAPKSDWPKDTESSPTRALTKSDANFAALLELIREMTAAAAKAASARSASAQPAAAPEPPSVVLKMAGNTTAGAANGVAHDSSAAQSTAQFLEYALADMTVLREHCLAFIKAPTTDAGRSNLSMLKQRLQTLSIGAEKTSCERLALLASAWEALVAEIERKPAMASPSILQTLAQAADCLRILLNNNTVNPMEPLPKAKVLSVDDDEICNEVAVGALQRANMYADSTQDANAALELLKQNNYDLVLLDINMPGLTGFELCEKLRALPQHAKTPVIFVTAFNNFENRKQSVLSGGGDLIAKPVAPLELALKVTIHLLKAPPKPVAAPAAPVAPSGLVWKEPAEIISHDTEMFLKGVEKLNLPTAIPSITETRTTDPEKEAVEAAAPIPTPEPVVAAAPAMAPARGLKPAPAAAPMPTLKMAPAPETKPEAEAGPMLKMTPAPEVKPEAKPAAVPTPAPAPAEVLQPVVAAAPVAAAPVAAAPVSAAAPIAAPSVKTVEAATLESVAKSRPPSDEGKVQPPRSSEPAVPASNGTSKEKKPMSQENKDQFETLVLDVAHIIFGDNAPEINVRLVRMAMEQVWKNRANLQTIDSIAKEIARIIFGDGNASDLNVRLVKMALESSNSIELFKQAA